MFFLALLAAEIASKNIDFKPPKTLQNIFKMFTNTKRLDNEYSSCSNGVFLMYSNGDKT